MKSVPWIYGAFPKQLLLKQQPIFLHGTLHDRVRESPSSVETQNVVKILFVSAGPSVYSRFQLDDS